MTKTDNGGRVIPDAVSEAVWKEWEMIPILYERPEHLPKPTFRDRFRARRAEIRWSIHDRMFPDCTNGDDW